MSLHNMRTIHGSKPNYSDEKRVGFAIRYSTPVVKQFGKYSKAILVQGNDSYNNFELVELPLERRMENNIVEYTKLH
ncbi:MAG: hypothetical protein V7K89_00590 [Nostoc sp.]|uniref:hypothetical protein n=1 Tax=Nostoc sp. TaxID=1180 RepID=UPI002FF95DAF